MTREDQEAFVRNLCCEVANDITTKIQEAALPESWDSHELRVLLAEKFKDSAKISIIIQEPLRKRARHFRADVLMKNL